MKQKIIYLLPRLSKVFLPATLISVYAFTSAQTLFFHSTTRKERAEKNVRVRVLDEKGYAYLEDTFYVMKPQNDSIRIELDDYRRLASTSDTQNFSAKKSKDGVAIFEEGKPVLFYRSAPKSVGGKYARAGFIHPLYDMSGRIISDDAPKDHPYHRGIFWAWHQVIVNGKNIADGWMSDNLFYKPMQTEVETNGNSAILTSLMTWNAKINNRLTPIARQKTSVTVFRSTPHYRMLDFTIHLVPLVNELKLGGSDDPKGYGGFSVRLKLPKDITFVSEGKQVTPEETAVDAGGWMDITGSFQGDTLPKSGVAIFAYPKGNESNLWILRSVTSMQNVPYPGRIPAILPKEGWHLNYRMLVHDESVTKETIEKLYDEWAK